MQLSITYKDLFQFTGEFSSHEVLVYVKFLQIIKSQNMLEQNDSSIVQEVVLLKVQLLNAGAWHQEHLCDLLAAHFANSVVR